MKPYLFYSVLYLLSMSASVCARSCGLGPLTLRYDRPAEFFEEALVIGNGNLGATLYGGIGEEKLSLNDITLWTGEPEKGVWNPDAYKTIPDIRAALDREDYRLADSLQRKVQGHYSENYQPLGTLTITYGGDSSAVSEYMRYLDISEAVAFRGYTSPMGKVESIYFASAPDSVIVIGIRCERPLTATLRLDSQLPHEVTASKDGIMRSQGYAAYSSLPNYAGSELYAA